MTRSLKKCRQKMEEMAEEMKGEMESSRWRWWHTWC